MSVYPSVSGTGNVILCDEFHSLEKVSTILKTTKQKRFGKSCKTRDLLSIVTDEES